MKIQQPETQLPRLFHASCYRLLIPGRRLAELLFIGPGKSGVISEAALKGGFHNRCSPGDQGTGKEKPFACNIAVDGAAGFFLSLIHI